MRKLISLTIILFVINNKLSFGQNLVPNPSFEDSVDCPVPINPNFFNYTYGWFSASGTPDYFNVCSSTPSFSVPINARGNQYPVHRDAYIDLICYGIGFPNEREIASIELAQVLSIGTRYYVSLFASRADGYSLNGAVNGIGAKFTVNPFSVQNPIAIDNQPHVFYQTIITDSINWTFISGSFISDSSYAYLNIGNFLDDQNTDTNIVISKAIYYIDMVCVSQDSTQCNQYSNLSPNHNSSVNTFHFSINNQNLNIFTKLNLQNTQVKIRNLLSQLSKSEVLDSSNSIYIGNLENGFYILTVYYKDVIATYKFIKL